jgi:tetratricopeptide (TPR) repeat protein
VRFLALAAFLLFVSACYRESPEAPPSPVTEAVRAYESAKSALVTGDTVQALEASAAAYARDPGFEDNTWLYASLLGREGRYDEALAICRILCQQSPGNVQAHLLEGILWDQSGDREAAHGAYDRALQVFSESNVAEHSKPAHRLYEAVAVYLRKGKLEGVRAVNAVLLTFPDYRPALYVKECMQDKNRAFLLRWFSKSGDENSDVE